jgi:cytochrome P450
MQTITELTLPYLPMDEASFAENPFPHFAKAREAHPWLATCPFGFVVHQYDAMRDLLSMDRNMRGAYESVVEIMGAHGTPWGRFQLESLLAQTGESHQRIRRVLAPAFTPQQANRHRALMKKVIARQLDEWVPKGAFDFEDFAAMFPITVFCGLVGAPPEVIPGLRSSLEAFGLSMSMDKAMLPRLVEATETLDRFVQNLTAQRRQAPHEPGEEDMLDVLIKTRDQGGLSDRELYDLLIFLFVAGYDTSKNALTLLMDTLIDRPDLYRRCAEDLGFARKVMEESFRHLTTSTIPRLVTKDFEYRGVAIPAGTLLFFPVSVSGRDPTAIPDPETFDPERDSTGKKHIAFGQGVHICLGQFIARAQIEEGLHQIAQRLHNPRRTGTSGWRPFFGVWGLRGLPIEFDPAPALEMAD